MATDDSVEHPDEEHVKRLLDQLAEILRKLPPDRQEAFQEYLSEQIQREAEGVVA